MQNQNWLELLPFEGVNYEYTVHCEVGTIRTTSMDVKLESLDCRVAQASQVSWTR